MKKIVAILVVVLMLAASPSVQAVATSPSSDYLSSYIPIIESEIAELIYDGAGSCFLYDLDADGFEELVILKDSLAFENDYGDPFPGYGYSVYDYEKGNVITKRDNELLFLDAGGPAGCVAAVKYAGNTAFMVYTDNGETGYRSHRDTIIKIYGPSTFQEIASASLSYIGILGTPDPNEIQVEGCTVNGEACSYQDYLNFEASIDRIVAAEYYDNEASDGSMDLYAMLRYLKGLPSNAPRQDPSSYSSVPALSTEGMSNAGTMLKNIRYDQNGKITSLSELLNGTWIHWVYEYDTNGYFLYRYRNIGSVNSTLTSEVMPGTDITYSELSAAIKNCVGLTLRYEVTKVRSGDGIGDRYLYIFDGRGWSLEATFPYDSYGVTYSDIAFDSPVTILRFATPRIHPDNSSFMIAQSLEDVMVADYCYIAAEGDKNATLVTPNIYTEERPHPSIQDMAGCKSGVLVPNVESWLPDYETKYVRASRGRAAYLRYTPDLDDGYFDLVREGTEVTILARQDGASLAKIKDGVVGWIGSNQLGDY